MANSISNYTGLSTGQYIDINSMISAALYNDNKALQLKQNQQSSIQNNISSLGQVRSSISSLQDAFNAVTKSLKSFTTSTLPEGLTVNPTTSGTHNITVSQLASAQINSFKQSFGTGALGFSGTLDLNSGTNSNGTFVQNKSTSISISSTDTLQDIAKKINDANPGFNANIINANGQQYLSLSSQTGSANAFEVVANDNNNSGLSALNLVAGGTNYNSVSTAKDGVATVDGIEIKSNTNKFTGVPGFEFTANKTFSNQTIQVNQDTTNLKEALQKFVTQYNSTKSVLANDGLNDSTLNNFVSNLRNSFYSVSSTDYANNLNNIGISFDKNGLMSFDSTKINDKSGSIISAQFTNNDKAINLFSNTLVAGKIDSLNNLYTNQSKALNNEISNMTQSINKKQLFYQSQYALLDNTLANINNNLGNVVALMQQFNSSK